MLYARLFKFPSVRSHDSYEVEKIIYNVLCGERRCVQGSSPRGRP